MPPSYPTLADDEERRGRILNAAALVLGELQDPDTAAAVAHVTTERLFDLLDTEEGQRAAVAHLDRMREMGEVLGTKVHAPMEKLVDLVHAQIEAGEVSASAAPKLLDVLFKLSGLAEQRAARLRLHAEDDGPKVTVHILHPGDADPPPAKAGQHQLTIDLRGQDRRKVIDVTPTDEGGDDGA